MNVRLRQLLLRWYRRHRRDLPWRRTTDPYRIWLSEIMLQQTQVATGLRYYERFVQRFPSVHALADAPLDEVLRYWAGLGYYARARNLHKAAHQVVHEHGGEFPDTVEGLRALPGVGRYTAGAIASIAFGRRAAIVDGNVARVLARWFAVRQPIKQSRTMTRLWELAESILPPRNCAQFNQAMMELGATVCTPRTPQCHRCPVERFCEAHNRGEADRYPVAAAARAPKPIGFVVAAIHCGGSYFFEPRPPGGLWGGLWQLPTGERVNGEATWRVAEQIASRLCRNVRISRRPLGEVRWQLTHRTARFTVHRCEARHQTRRPTGRWLAVDSADQVPLSSATRRILMLLRRST